jgi:hypothetical protein
MQCSSDRRALDFCDPYALAMLLDSLRYGSAQEQFSQIMSDVTLA